MRKGEWFQLIISILLGLAIGYPIMKFFKTDQPSFQERLEMRVTILEDKEKIRELESLIK